MRLLRPILAALLLALTAAPALSAGTIFGLPLSQQFGATGKPLPGAKLYIYEANTTNPVTAFEDFELSVELPWPIEADGAGRLPKFWLEDGSYRARLTDADGVVQFDIQSVIALGPSTGEGGGDEGEGVSELAVFQTGDIMWQPRSGTRSGWVRANGRTIGSAASGATERANADTQALYEHLWTTYSNALCPVTGGRGASAAADFAANKPIATLDMRSAGAFGLDDMGNSAKGTEGGSTSVAALIGSPTTSITILQTNLPSVNLSHSLTAASHQHTYSGTTSTIGNHTHDAGGSVPVSAGGGSNVRTTSTGSVSTSGDGSHSHTYSGTTSASGSLGISGTVALGGSGTALTPNVLNPMRAGTWYFKL